MESDAAVAVALVLKTRGVERRRGSIPRAVQLFVSIAQLAEQAALNGRVVGSNPTGDTMPKPMHLAV